MNSVEVELKFQVPAAALEGVRRAMAGNGTRTVHLQAAYADTADLRLAGAFMALRLRREGERWVQTLKGRGDGLMARLEHGVPLPAGVRRPRLNPARHAGTAAGDALARLLADGAPLEERYRTDIQRLLRTQRSGGARVELALDLGHIAAAGRSLAVCEIEFELLSGPVAALLALAETWVVRHGLWLDVRTKSEMGQRLAGGLQAVPATRLPVMRPSAAQAQQRQAALAQMLPNAAEIAAGSGTHEQLQALQAGLQRLLRALQAGKPAPAGLRRSWTRLQQALSPVTAPLLLQAPVFTVLVLRTLALHADAAVASEGS